MTNKKFLSREDKKHLREFLSYNPFFKEMDKYLHKSGYCKNGYSDEHLCLEQMWLLAIIELSDADILYHDMGMIPSFLGDSEHYDYDTCYFLMTVRFYLTQARYRGIDDIITDEEAAWQCVENEIKRLDFNEENTWHVIYANFIKTLYLNHNVNFANGKHCDHRTAGNQPDTQLHIQHKNHNHDK